MTQDKLPHVHRWSYVGGMATAYGIDQTEECACGAVRETIGGYGCLETKVVEPPR